MNSPQFHQISSAQIEQFRLQMIKFAMLQLNDLPLAEDVVQEALVSAYKNAHSFKGESALKTWIFAILKNKIIDLLHDRHRNVNVSEIFEEQRPNEFFDHTGYWNSQTFEPQEWHNVEQLPFQKDFWRVFDACLNNLPAQQARVFMMREYLELSSAEICQECQISTANLHVILHRARLQLQSCLTKHWFGEAV